MLHQQGDTVLTHRRKQHVHMIRHQHIGMYSTARFIRLLSQHIQIAMVIIGCIKTGAAIIAVLKDMPRDTRYRQTRSSRHVDLLVRPAGEIDSTSG
jgi:hypothetical protein